MAQNGSIMSYFPKTPKKTPSSPLPGDGFTSAEIARVTDPTSVPWEPPQPYSEVSIDKITPGPRCISFTGRVANLYETTTSSKNPQAAKGFLRIVVKDTSGTIMVKLWYTKTKYALRLGQLVRVWTYHVSFGDKKGPAGEGLFTSIFPETDRACWFEVIEGCEEEARTPLGWKRRGVWLMTLKDFVSVGCDVPDARVLVCVKSVGPKKKTTNKNGVSSEMVTVNVFDHTGEASLTVWNVITASAAEWTPSETVLLLSNPSLRVDKYTRLSLSARSLVDVDPAIPDADWLRKYAKRAIRREHVNPPWPEGVFDLEAAANSQNRVLFSFAFLDEFARVAPKEKFTGYLSVIIMELRISELYRRERLMCNECCGIPLFANAPTLMCRNCEKPVALRMNPKIIGQVIDETGCAGPGKLLLSEKAWEQLLGRTAAEFVRLDAANLRFIEQRLLFLRVTMRFAWAAEEGEGGVGRVWIWGVEP
ncbi:hypothetical protein EJ06DRAFT_559428 [Trichodelitschia bisporula]|uniref:Nucleic acid-binding protein n=1 Tax=Trichodelitschia bisporula TaxID=703511 RepID=A0A6G1HL29_9PEZI|nr:hypothetical protein EJ06DRAFT_559428 [Trichodelitschia bisporula]